MAGKTDWVSRTVFPWIMDGLPTGCTVFGVQSTDGSWASWGGKRAYKTNTSTNERNKPRVHQEGEMAQRFLVRWKVLNVNCRASNIRFCASAFFSFQKLIFFPFYFIVWLVNAYTWYKYKSYKRYTVKNKSFSSVLELLSLEATSVDRIKPCPLPHPSPPPS